MEMKKYLSFRNAIFVLTFSLFCIVFCLYTLVSYFVIRHSLENSFKEKIIVSQNLFADSIQNDISSGFFGEAYRKCKVFFESGGLSSINVTDAGGATICDFNINGAIHSEIGQIKTQSYFNDKKNITATITANYSDLPMRQVLEKCVYIILLTVVLIAILLSIFVKYMSRYFGTPVHEISKLLQTSHLNEIANASVSVKSNFKEIEYLYQSVSDMAKKILDTQKQLVEKTEMEAISKIASKVAHDIRSPLSALNVYIKCISTLPENERLFIRNATERINDIANNLVAKFKNELTIKDNSPSSEIISIMVDQIVSEKRVLYAGKNIKFDLNIEEKAYMLFSKVNSGEFQSVISNLINNAVESISGEGTIFVTLKSEGNFLNLKISDTGCGMSPGVLKKAIAGGISTKPQGLGLGLSSSIGCIQKWNCTIDILSQENKGTDIIIKMPVYDPPYWFPQNIRLSPNSTLVILDDDQSIHDILCHRLASIIKPSHHIKIVNFKDPYKFIEFYNNYDKNKMISFLFDYEFVGSNLTGTDLIDKFSITTLSTLITSRFEDSYVREKCKKSGIKLIPKNMAYFIPINVHVS